MRAVHAKIAVKISSQIARQFRDAPGDRAVTNAIKPIVMQAM
jgi:hypothetical protein